MKHCEQAVWGDGRKWNPEYEKQQNKTVCVIQLRYGMAIPNFLPMQNLTKNEYTYQPDAYKMLKRQRLCIWHYNSSSIILVKYRGNCPAGAETSYPPNYFEIRTNYLKRNSKAALYQISLSARKRCPPTLLGRPIPSSSFTPSNNYRSRNWLQAGRKGHGSPCGRGALIQNRNMDSWNILYAFTAPEQVETCMLPAISEQFFDAAAVSIRIHLKNDCENNRQINVLARLIHMPASRLLQVSVYLSR